MNKKTWDDSQIETLKILWTTRNENGSFISARQIGNAIGKSKDAIIGMAHRLNLPLREKGNVLSVRQVPPALKEKAAAVAVRKPWRKSTTLKVITVPKSDDDQANTRPLDFKQLALPGVIPIPFMQIKAEECRSVLDQRGEDGLALFCGAPTAEGFSYCEYHCQLYHQPVRSRGISNGGRATTPITASISNQEPAAQPTQCSGGQGDQPEAPERRTATG